MLEPVVRRTWSPKGQTPMQYRWDRHDRLSVIMGITLSPVRQRLGLYFRIHCQNILYEHVIAFVTWLHRQLGCKFIWVLDRYSAHRKAVRLLRAAHPDWFRGGMVGGVWACSITHLTQF